MKKQFEQPIIELVIIESEDIIKTSSGSYNPNSILDGDNVDSWY